MRPSAQPMTRPKGSETECGRSASRQSGKEVKQIIAELNPVLRAGGITAGRGTCRREFHQMDDFVYPAGALATWR